MPFVFEQLSIPDIIMIRPRVFGDARGFFVETYKYSEFATAGIREYFVQDNHSRSGKGILRGLHYQKDPAAQGKLLRCIRGGIFDVAVDIRKGSPYYGQWVGAELSEADGTMLYVPAGFAHGFLALQEGTEIMYKCTAEYSPDNERGIIWNDSAINIAWPISEPMLSTKDRIHPGLHDADNNFVYHAGKQ